MSKELIPLNINSYNYEHRKNVLKFLDSFYFPKIKIKEEIKGAFKIVTVGTIARVEKDGIWYDIPYMTDYHFHISLAIPDSEYHNMYKILLENVYKTIHFYIVREDYDFKSIFQCTEKERLYETYYKNQATP